MNILNIIRKQQLKKQRQYQALRAQFIPASCIIA